MMRSVSIHEAKTQLSALIAMIERTKEKVVIMKHNNAVAELIPIPHGNRIEPHAELMDIEILYDPAESTEQEWEDA